MTAIAIRDLTVEYQAAGYVNRPLDGFHADIGDGDLTLLLGPSGSGKTTLLSCLGGLLRPTSGHLLVGDTDVATLDEDDRREYRRRTVGFVFQSFNLIASLSARDNVAAPLIAQGVRRSAARSMAEQALGQVGMADHARSRPGKLSGGQQQRVAVARGIVHGPQVLLADEPTANLDFVQAESVIGLLRDLAAPGRAVVISTHDDRLLPIADGAVDLSPAAPLATARRGTHTLDDGELLFDEGDLGDVVYAVESGGIELFRRHDGDDEVLRLVGCGEYFGELAPLFGQRRSAAARARGVTTVRGLSVPEFRERSRRERGAVLPDRAPPRTVPGP